MSYHLDFTDRAMLDLKAHAKFGNKSLLKKLSKLFEELTEHPSTGTGHPEQLKHFAENVYSRRINQKHRLIYSIEEEIVSVIVISAYGHYGDK